MLHGRREYGLKLIGYVLNEEFTQYTNTIQQFFSYVYEVQLFQVNVYNLTWWLHGFGSKFKTDELWFYPVRLKSKFEHKPLAPQAILLSKSVFANSYLSDSLAP